MRSLGPYRPGARLECVAAMLPRPCTQPRNQTAWGGPAPGSTFLSNFATLLAKSA